MKIFSLPSVLLLCCLLTGIRPATIAQTKDSTNNRGRWGVEGRADKISDKISRQVGLNRDQYQQIYNINADIIRRMDAIRANTELPKKERMQQFKALETERSQRFKNVLTAAQYKKWNDWEMSKKEHLEEKMEKKRQRKQPARP
jgi:Spy/CpxP family protein refolding chaperone